MNNSKKETRVDPDVAKRRRRNKASRIRTKDPAKVTPEEASYLAEYDATEGRAAVDPLAATVDAGHLVAQAEPSSPPDAPSSPPAPADAPPPAQDAELPPAPPRLPWLPPAMPPPPRVDSAPAAKGGGRSSWRDKYGEAMGGREMACVLLGNSVHEFCVAAQEMIALSGGRPVVDAKAMLPIFVLAADDLLPPHVEATPAVIAGVTTVSLSLQALVRRKQIKDVQAKLKGKAGAGKLIAMDGGKKAPPPVDTPSDRASPDDRVDAQAVEEQAEPAAEAEQVAPVQPADGRPPERESDYNPERPGSVRFAPPPGFEGIT